MIKIISELCSNHRGDPGLLKEMIHASKEAGATHCKIQSFFADDLAPEWQSTGDRLKRSELSWKDHAVFVLECERAQITPMTTVPHGKHLQKIADAGFRWVKIGSPQATDVALISAAKMMGLKVVLSTGGHAVDELTKITPLEGVLHCVSKYPSEPWEANLSRMLELKWRWKQSIGLSDHTDPTSDMWSTPCEVAMSMGAEWIEKHFTLKADKEDKDFPVSITFRQLKHLCDFAKLTKEDMLTALDERYVPVGLFFSPQDEAERLLISKYKGRWQQ